MKGTINTSGERSEEMVVGEMKGSNTRAKKKRISFPCPLNIPDLNFFLLESLHIKDDKTECKQHLTTNIVILLKFFDKEHVLRGFNLETMIKKITFI